MSQTLPRSALTQTTAILLAGGRGARLHELTAHRCKAALPLFSTRKGPLRMVDFTMANVVRSGLPRLIATMQYRPADLETHLIRRWAPLFQNKGLMVRNDASVQSAIGSGGTAAAVAASASEIDAAGTKELIVLAGDHVYQMDYSGLVAEHRRSGARVTLAVHSVPAVQADGYGIVEAEESGRITGFNKKQGQSAEHPSNPSQCLVSMGVYVFDWNWLRARLPHPNSDVDFGVHILPAAVADGVVAGFLLPALPGQSGPFWRDVGSLGSLRETVLEFTHSPPCFLPVLPGPAFCLSDLGVGQPTGAPHLTDSVLLPGATMEKGARLTRAIVAPGTRVPGDLIVGEDPSEDALWFRHCDDGTVLITNAMLARRAKKVLGQLRAPLLRAFNLPTTGQ